MASLRYRKSRNSADQLGQVLTPPTIAQLISRGLVCSAQASPMLIDLGAGKGALSLATLKRFHQARVLAIEIDSDFASELRMLRGAQITVVEGDALFADISAYEPPDIILSNPPYSAMPATPALREMLRESGLEVPMKGPWVRSDIAFIARAWGLAERGTQLGLIVAAPIVQSSFYQDVRRRLAEELGNLVITKLPVNTFANTEVQAFVISGQRKVSRRRNILLRRATIDGVIVDEIEISNAASLISWDIEYHQSILSLGLKCSNLRTLKTLGSVGAKISRGSRSSNQFESMGLSAFHTTDFPKSMLDVVLSGAVGEYNTAHAGDILIPRVGTRCLDKQARVSDGVGLITDCVYRITATEKTRNLVWRSLSSSFGIEWRLANAAGSCAKYLTHDAVMSMPLMA